MATTAEQDYYSRENSVRTAGRYQYYNHIYMGYVYREIIYPGCRLQKTVPEYFGL